MRRPFLLQLLFAILLAGCLTIESGPQTDVLEIEIFTEETGADGPHSPSPADGATGVSVDRLSWRWGMGQMEGLVYEVYLEAGDDSPDRPVCSDLIAVVCRLTEELAFGTTYYWQVTAVDSQGRERRGPVWQFETAAAFGGK
jgi:hypothetical protein